MKDIRVIDLIIIGLIGLVMVMVVSVGQTVTRMERRIESMDGAINAIMEADYTDKR